MTGEPVVIVRAREELRRAVSEVAALRQRLGEVYEAIPPTEQETGPNDIEGPYDVETEMRAVLEHVTEELDRLHGELRDGADYRPVRKPGEALGRSDDEAYRTLRALVVKENFEPGAMPADLTVFQMFGRWFATYTDPDTPAHLPERERRELLAIQEDPGSAGKICYVEL